MIWPRLKQRFCNFIEIQRKTGSISGDWTRLRLVAHNHSWISHKLLHFYVFWIFPFCFHTKRKYHCQANYRFWVWPEIHVSGTLNTKIVLFKYWRIIVCPEACIPPQLQSTINRKKVRVWLRIQGSKKLYRLNYKMDCIYNHLTLVISISYLVFCSFLHYLCIFFHILLGNLYRREIWILNASILYYSGNVKIICRTSL